MDRIEATAHDKSQRQTLFSILTCQPLIIWTRNRQVDGRRIELLILRTRLFKNLTDPDLQTAAHPPTRVAERAPKKWCLPHVRLAFSPHLYDGAQMFLEQFPIFCRVNWSDKGGSLLLAVGL